MFGTYRPPPLAQLYACATSPNPLRDRYSVCASTLRRTDTHPPSFALPHKELAIIRTGPKTNEGGGEVDNKALWQRACDGSNFPESTIPMRKCCVREEEASYKFMFHHATSSNNIIAPLHSSLIAAQARLQVPYCLGSFTSSLFWAICRESAYYYTTSGWPRCYQYPWRLIYCIYLLMVERSKCIPQLTCQFDFMQSEGVVRRDLFQNRPRGTKQPSQVLCINIINFNLRHKPQFPVWMPKHSTCAYIHFMPLTTPSGHVTLP